MQIDIFFIKSIFYYRPKKPMHWRRRNKTFFLTPKVEISQYQQLFTFTWFAHNEYEPPKIFMWVWNVWFGAFPQTIFKMTMVWRLFGLLTIKFAIVEGYFWGLMQLWIFLFRFRSCAISIINQRGYLYFRVSEGKIFCYIEGIY